MVSIAGMDLHFVYVTNMNTEIGQIHEVEHDPVHDKFSYWCLVFDPGRAAMSTK